MNDKRVKCQVLNCKIKADPVVVSTEIFQANGNIRTVELECNLCYRHQDWR